MKSLSLLAGRTVVYACYSFHGNFMYLLFVVVLFSGKYVCLNLSVHVSVLLLGVFQ